MCFVTIATAFIHCQVSAVSLLKIFHLGVVKAGQRVEMKYYDV